jgi:hypothetical protein
MAKIRQNDASMQVKFKESFPWFRDNLGIFVD